MSQIGGGDALGGCRNGKTDDRNRPNGRNRTLRRGHVRCAGGSGLNGFVLSHPQDYIEQTSSQTQAGFSIAIRGRVLSSSWSRYVLLPHRLGIERDRAPRPGRLRRSDDAATGSALAAARPGVVRRRDRARARSARAALPAASLWSPRAARGRRGGRPGRAPGTCAAPTRSRPWPWSRRGAWRAGRRCAGRRPG